MYLKLCVICCLGWLSSHLPKKNYDVLSVGPIPQEDPFLKNRDCKYSSPFENLTGITLEFGGINGLN